MSEETELTIEGYKRFTVKRRWTKRRKSPIYRKCADLMQKLYLDNYVHRITYKEMKRYVREYCGGFRTTVTDYIGRRAKYYTSPGRKGVLRSERKSGYLEDFGFIEYETPKMLILFHDRVDRDYHWAQSNIEDFSHTFSEESMGKEGTIMEPIERERRERDRECLRENRESESNISMLNEIKTLKFTPEELAVLRSASKGGS